MKLTSILALNEGAYSKLAEWEAAAKKLGYTVTTDNKSGTYHAWDKTSHKGRFSAPTGKGSLTEGILNKIADKVMGKAPTNKFKVGDDVSYEMDPPQEGGRGKGKITSVSKAGDHYTVNGKLVNHFEIKKKHSSLDEGVGATIKQHTRPPVKPAAKTHKSGCGWNYGHDCDLDNKQGVEEGVVDTIKRGVKKLTAPVKDPILDQMKSIADTANKRTRTTQNVKYTPKAVKEAAKRTDLTDCKCMKCKKGTYQETSQTDDTDGILHCTNCGMKVDRYKTVNEAYTGHFNDDDWYEVDPKTNTVLRHAGGHARYREPETLPNGNVIMRGMKAKHLRSVEEGIGDTIKRTVKKLTAPVKDPILDKMKDIADASNKRERDAQNKKYTPSNETNEDWQKANKQDKTDGMNPKAVATYRREHYDTYGSNKDVPLKKGATKTVYADTADAACAEVKKLVGGRNHKAECIRKPITSDNVQRLTEAATPVLQESVINEASPLSAAGFSSEFINVVYRTFAITHTTLLEPMSAKPKASDLDKFVFVSRTPSGKAFAAGKGESNWSGLAYAQLIIDNDGKIEYQSAPASKALAVVEKGQYYAIPFGNSYDRIRGQGSTEYKRSQPAGPKPASADSKAHAYLKHLDKLHGSRIRAEMEKVVDFVYANMRKFGNQRNSNLSGTSPQERVLAIANKLEKLSKDPYVFTKRPGSWDQPSYMEQYLNSLDKLSHGTASIPNNYHQFVETMDATPAGLAKFAKFILGTIRDYENQVKELLAKTNG